MLGSHPEHKTEEDTVERESILAQLVVAEEAIDRLAELIRKETDAMKGDR